jgi:hypothetical protein
VAWVLQWSAAIAILCLSTGVLLEFAYCLAAEHTLARAARAGALEATLPRATHISVAESIERRLVNHPRLAASLQIAMTQNGVPLRGRFIPRPGDRISITLSAPTRQLLPSWLRPITFWSNSTQIIVSAERQLQGRTLKLRPEF